MPPPITLGYLVPQFPGQTHIFFWREIAALEERGVYVRIFSTRKPARGLIAHDWSAEAMARTTYLGQVRPVTVLSALSALPAVPCTTHAGFARDIALSLAAARDLVTACLVDGITHVHVHSCGRAALIAALARRLGGPTYSLTLHGPLSDYGPGQPFKWQGARFATVITEKLLAEVRQALPGHLPPRLLVQPMGVDTAVLRRDRPYQSWRPGETLRLFACGRLHRVKGHQDLIAAIKLIRDCGQPVSLAIAGEDDAGGTGYRRVLEAQITALGLAGTVQLLGAIDAKAVKAQLLQAHAFVLASWHEPLGVALMEAMSCEVPTIGTAAGGVAELITDGVDGVLVPPQNPALLADTILRVTRDPALCMALGRAGRARVEQAFHAGLGAEALIREIAG